ncbi:hypothetical protein [Sedimenticola hydrogenitrophicus]|uniref:hypothetical protein n=1 Tax=Sedimenticola hydrogenitrophicus TaxID=2967975 RepID=UPI0023AF7499|nr:hypothetical protein [Sedimenticola hydrogenitrophicus]
MHTDSVKRLWKTLLLVIGMTALNAAVATDAPETFQVVDGVTIYLGVMPAQIVQGHAREHEESKMHGGVSAGRYRNHLVVALFDNATGRRIEDAQVTAAVSELGMRLERKTLEPMRIADTTTYGNYFSMPSTGIYRIQLRLRRPGQARAIEATFTHGQVGR